MINLELLKSKNENLVLKAIFSKEAEKHKIVKRLYEITEHVVEKTAYIYLAEKEKFTTWRLVKALRTIFSTLSKDITLDLDSFVTHNIKLEAVLKEAIISYDYVSDKLYTERKKDEDEKEYHVSLLSSKADSIKDSNVSSALRMAKAVSFARTMQSTPPNIANSEYLADVYKQLAEVKAKNVKVTVLDKQEIEKENMNLFLSVNKGSVYQPRLVVIEYMGDPNSKEKTAIVGKGITFDSGGYSLKPSTGMRTMKYDMSGSAIAVAAVVAASRMNLKKNFVAVAPLTDNRINGDANLPDNVVISKSGISVEITNTDAEGRLILADAITYAIQNLNATEIIDIATLTGAIKIAFGDTYTGVFATDDADFEKFKKASLEVNENIWRLPFDPAFLKATKKTKVADLVNADYQMGGSISAAMFLNEFVKKEDKNVKHIHIDIAGTAKVGDDFTAVMTKTLIQYLASK
ncbi:leucyl aminopeptidase [Mycoplasma testudineum]|uniref:Probable cytosol aminopeptidase n=1 Tax=Mycoplasma testudineum TaxID=244584 RepID=A0A4R6IBX9_9MOLU|nr:hypothetical protein [Mycoplasma testudineum]OYD26545.1 peptidase M17 [Mycoplasma testudineum]TDO19116.1 leucyl aminopeptidase [Mycoplasma testudineum]